MHVVGKWAFSTHIGFCAYREVFKGTYLGRLISCIWMAGARILRRSYP